MIHPVRCVGIKIRSWIKKASLEDSNDQPTLTWREAIANAGTRSVLIVGGILLVVNLGFGFADTISWPFTCYPTFAYLVPDNTHTVAFEKINQEGEIIPLDKKVLEDKYSVERYRYYEWQLFDAISRGDAEVRDNWLQKLNLLWVQEDTVLTSGDRLRIYEVELRYVPEGDFRVEERERKVLVELESQ